MKKWKIIIFVLILLFSIYKVIDSKNLDIKDNVYIVSQSDVHEKESISNNISDENDNQEKEKIKIDGVFAVTDRHALDFIKRLENINVNVPKDVQVIGFDGSRSFSQDEFKISTIRQPVELMAKKSVEALINIIEDKPLEKKVILPINFIKGYTTK